MKIPVLLVLSCFVLTLDTITGLPVTTPQKGLTLSERAILREILCLLKKISPEECDGDDAVGEIVTSVDNFHRNRARTRMNHSKTDETKPLPPSSKREAFYSDWRRK